ncbi:hypothetical protein [Nocardia thraciensis]
MRHLRWRLESAVATAQRPLNLETATRLRRRVEALAREVETGSFTGVERSTLCRLRHRAVQTAELAVRRADTA